MKLKPNFNMLLQTFPVNVVFSTILWVLNNQNTAYSMTASTKLWKMNTNMNNMDNWIGYDGTNCSKNILSFPVGLEKTVISFPTNASIGAQTILLPNNGYFVFQNGSTTLYNLKTDSCTGVELKFARTTRANWFDANNWLCNTTSNIFDYFAIPHVERVPCQYDSIRFPNDSTFHINISAKVTVAKFFLGTKELSYMEVAYFMSTKIGKLQFLKDNDTTFDLTKDSWEDTDEFICDNYKNEMKELICSKTKCLVDEKAAAGGEECSNPFTPEGFCCPICGIHIDVQHSGNLHLIPVRTKLERLVNSHNLGSGLESQVGIYVTRYARKFVHVIFILKQNVVKEKGENVIKLINELTTFLKQDQQVVSTKLTHSWGTNWNPTGNNALTSSGGLSSGVITLIVIIIILCATLLLIYIWNKRGYPPVTFDTILSRVPSLPSFREGINFGSTALRRGSVAFARFSNERVSTINIGQRAAASGEESSIERTEPVDAETKPIETPVPDRTEVGFTNLTYDLIGVGGGSGHADDTSVKETAAAKDAQTKLGTTKETAAPKQETEHVYDLVDVSDDTTPIVNPQLPKKTDTYEE